MMPQKFILPFLIIVVIVLGIGLFLFFRTNQQQQLSPPAISSFDECVAAGNPVMESYPPQCRTQDGESFTQDIGNEMELMDVILAENPRPNQTISSPLTVKGRARGTYFFEASFPIRLVDENGRELAESYVEAQGEWMTEEFVPFSGELEFTTSAKSGTLFLEKSNPSGLPENKMVLEVPVRFE